ncbi:MAG: putative transporter permease [Paenibacillus sp.]|jgi:ABC-2 type transport system permease protein|nr:putative transporter permease [Paenibacillus sp.]
MSFVLYKALLKRNSRLIIGYGLGSSLYLLLMAMIYPSMKETIADKMDMVADMPEGFRAAFGVDQGMSIQSVTDLLSMQYYSMIFLILMTLFTLSLAGRMLAHFIEQGSMAYLLSVPWSRAKVVITVIAVIVTGLFLVVASNLVFSYVGAYMTGETIENGAAFIRLHLLGFLLFMAIGGYSLLFAALTGDERKTVAFAGGLTLLFYVLDLAGKLSSGLSGKRPASVFYWFQPSEILAGSGSAAAATGVFIGMAVIGFCGAVIVFKRKSLML